MNTKRTNTIERRTSESARAGFTLVELLVVMTIMIILATMAAMVMSGAEESGKIAHTRATIDKINSLVMARYESYAYRRLPVSLPPMNPSQAAAARCDLIRELMKMEMPDHWNDIKDAPVTHNYKDISNNAVTITLPRSAISQAYVNYVNSQSYNSNYPYSAKCLYLLVTMGLEEPDILENFSSDEIGVDTDGYKYFVDAWGNPIAFLRWAPGFVSSLQPKITTTAANANLAKDQTDPMGVYGTPPNTFALYPLIYSAGPDGAYDLVDGGPTFSYASTTPPNDPFNSIKSGTGFGSSQVGTSFTVLSPNRPLGVTDNITNHNMAGR